jgi:phage gp36-like protein
METIPHLIHEHCCTVTIAEKEHYILIQTRNSYTDYIKDEYYEGIDLSNPIQH